MPQSFVFAFTCPKRLKDDPAASLLPLGFLSMAATLKRAGHKATAVHLGRMSRRDALEVILDGDPSVVGFTCFSFQRARTLEMARLLRERCGPDRPRILLGGPHAGPLAREIVERCPWIDGVARGEGERTVETVATRLDAGEPLAGIPGLVIREGSTITDGGAPELIEDLDSLPVLAESDLTLLGVDRRFQLRHLITGRGCTGRCSFCYAPEAWSGCVRTHSVDRICRELAELKRRYGLIYMSFRDDMFTADQAWTQAFCRALIERELDLLWDCQSSVNRLDAETIRWMRRAGCLQIQLGVESGSPKILKALRKPFALDQLEDVVAACRQVGMLVSWYLITGVPGERKEDIVRTEKLVKTLKPASLVVSRLSAYPGTELAASIPEALWFKEDPESFFVRDDKHALKHYGQLLRLAERTGKREPYTMAELMQAAALLDDAPPALLAVARLHEAEGRTSLAEETYQSILSAKPAYPWAALGLGELYLETGRPEDAIPHLKSVVDNVPGWPHPLNRYGWALVLAGKKSEGYRLIEEAQALEPLAPQPPSPLE